MENLSQILEKSAYKFGENTALIFEGEKYTYKELDRMANKFANALVNLGGGGQFVGLFLPNIPEFLICYHGILKAGATVVPMNVMLKEREILHILNDANLRYVITTPDLQKEVLKAHEKHPSTKLIVVGNGNGESSFYKLIENEPDDFVTRKVSSDNIAVILYTSGTTGKAKGAMLTHLNMYSNAVSTAKNYECSEKDVGVFALPLFHSYALTLVVGAVFSQGATLVMHRRFIPEEIFYSLIKYKATIFYGVPTMYIQLLNHPYVDKYTNTNLRYCIGGGASLPVEVLKNWNAKFNIEITEGYGLSEASPDVARNPLRGVKKPGSIGIPMCSDILIKVVDDNDKELKPHEVGELIVKGPNVMKGYLNLPEETREALRGGWLHTGDLAYKDEDGYIFIVDRKKDMIIKGGFNIYPREIEEVLYTHPKILEAGVIGIPDKEKGEEVVACVVLKPGEVATEDEIIQFCRDNLAVYKAPRIVKFFETFPKGPSGKILKRELKELTLTKK